MRLAVISPFLDRQHGTERCVVEQLERFATYPDVEIHLYSQRVADLASAAPNPSAAGSTRIVWHRVPSLPGPHLFAYIWWFCANHLQRLWDRHVRNLSFDAIYSPGINAFDADVITVHIVFEELSRRLRSQLTWSATPVSGWVRLLHRRLYYNLIRALERRIYSNPGNRLAAVSILVGDQLRRYYGRSDPKIINNGVDAGAFNPTVRVARRPQCREKFRLLTADLAMLLIGNDWKKKGLLTLFQALARVPELSLKLIVVGNDDRSPYNDVLRDPVLQSQVFFLSPSPDVMQFYAAADVYVGPSLEDAYGLPILEAMACGLPVIASSRAGASEIIVHGKNGMILQDPQDPLELARLLRELYSNPDLRERLGREARQTAEQQSWDRNAAQTWELLQNAAASKKQRAVRKR